MAEIHSGSCLCGAVRFSVAAPLRGVIYCHCTQCRKQTGHYYAATNVPDAALAVTGADQVTWYAASADARRGFCRTCGSTLFWKAQAVSYTSILAGSFDGATGLVGMRHDFIGDKGDYYEITDGLPQNLTFPA